MSDKDNVQSRTPLRCSDPTAYVIQCTMCGDTRACPECDPDAAPNEDCVMCFGSGACPECGEGGDE